MNYVTPNTGKDANNSCLIPWLFCLFIFKAVQMWIFSLIGDLLYLVMPGNASNGHLYAMILNCSKPTKGLAFFFFECLDCLQKGTILLYSCPTVKLKITEEPRSFN